MGTTYFTSDLHFGHTKIVSLSHRPFSNVDEMNHTIIKNWNAVVKPEDNVWVLGDLAVEGSYKLGIELAQQLVGRKRLIMGNHDRCWVGKSDSFRYYADYFAAFEAVLPWARAKIGATKVLLSHFPYSGDHTLVDRHNEYRLRPSDVPLICGHVHGEWKISYASAIQINVGVDQWDYTPVASHTLEKILLEDSKLPK
jgi:calcineurin-like phosphoesterase family protein